MAHTDRDFDRWERNHHAGRPCPYNDREVLPFVGGRLPVHAIHCETCDRLWDKSRVRYYISVEAKPAWNKAMRREERAKTRNVLNRARTGHIDWDDLAINYRRPYFD